MSEPIEDVLRRGADAGARFREALLQKRGPVRSFLFWLVVDSRVPLGPLAPWLFGLAIGRQPRKVNDGQK